MSLRQQQKELSQKVILDAAVKLFGECGYDKTTTLAIANSAGVGVATIFRHFGSKAALLAAIAQRDVEAVIYSGRNILKAPPDSPADGIANMLTEILKIVEMPSSSFRWQSDLWIPAHSGRPEADAVVSWADAEVRKLILALLTHYRIKEKIYEHLNLRDLSAIIFAIFNQHFFNFVTRSDVSQEKLLADVDRRVRLLFEPWQKLD